MRVVVVAGERSRAVTALTAADVEVVLTTSDPAAAVIALSRFAPDAGLVDLELGPDGQDAVAMLAETVPVLAVAGTAEHTDVLATVRAGAAGYLVGPVGASRLADALRRVAAGETVFSPGLAEIVLEEYGRMAGGPAGHDVRLTEREADVLRLVVDGHTGKQIAARLVLSPRTVENHVQNTLRKLGLPNRAALVRYAIEHGLA
jgi:DNA-binding NarL/FixJ family response regulator